MKKNFIPENIQFQRHYNNDENIPCPLCDRKLIRESQIFSDGSIPTLYCQTCIQFLPEGKLINHFRQSFYQNKDKSIWTFTTMIIPPYRIESHNDESRVGIIARYKTGHRKFYFKHLLTCPTIPPTSEEKIMDKIKMIKMFQ
jgi:hypothetical protein